ncbi:Nucleoside-diphosphate-sugar epimerase [Amycolatopsis xylanica]|uniref:Nucleoside-diphosphate-sugar epimerase n=1 Tax=Amycolatopsis xylanica TaxID=589385 RepID=A0A1H2VV99_9PSEU|nr:NAD(P)-dependent oxidoreductase [Amycolatopsis xylanica]SDW72352.1 Nucleoside-diphosphate-sugar epimerase [Amycolatopsis xylanica]
MKRILLFGASGFLGRAVVSAFTGNANLVCAGRGARDEPGWIKHDLEHDSLESVLRQVRPDAVVNCTGRLDGTTAELVSANVLATARLLDAVSSSDIRLVTLGSAGEYGAVPVGHPVAEDAPAEPVAAYGVTKLAATRLVQSAVDSGVDAVSLRVFNPIGAGMPAGTVLGRAAARIREARISGQDFIELGPLDAYRDFVDVRDVASAIAAAALSAELKEPVLNVGSGTAVRTRDAVALLAEVAGFTGPVREAGAAQARSGAVNWIAADVSRAKLALGWTPRYSLEDSIHAIWHEE